MVKSRLHGMILASLFAALMGIGANITSLLPFFVIAGVPITFQPVVSLLAGTLLGKKYGPLAMTIYLFIGLAGIPVFARFSGGISAILSPTFGFLLAFIFVAWVAGVVTEKSKSFKMLLVASLIGTVIVYIIGTNWMYLAYSFWFAAPEGFSYKMGWTIMMVPLPKDIALSVLSAMISYKVLRAFPAKTQSSSTIKNEVIG
ncbi:biotin transporter BioY [Psychrobacillus sp. OK032]|uniref:biotin transporter BioY n=1 Tax=Psychrobacillus sp. OK032 TaxID=1884358 RepID=UPI0008B27C9F|nr:biotin transport system substrate-specific component [Psychrobacillus sp. OK032]